MPCGKLPGMLETPGDRLKDARDKAGFRSARAAALHFHWTPSTYASHENGQTGEIPHAAARKYAKAFRVSAAWLLNGEGDMRPVIAKDRLEKLLKSIPADRQPEAIQFLEFLASRTK